MRIIEFEAKRLLRQMGLPVPSGELVASPEEAARAAQLLGGPVVLKAQMNQVRARTSTRNPVIRLLLVGLAFALFNLYITLRQNLSSALKKPFESPRRFWLSLRRLALMLARAIERLWGIAEVLQLQPCVTFS